MYFLHSERRRLRDLGMAGGGWGGEGGGGGQGVRGGSLVCRKANKLQKFSSP